MELDKLWSAVLSEIELNTTKASFITWFQYVFLLDVKDGVAHIGVPDSFAKEWIENKFSKIILKILRGLNSDIKDVQVLINPSNKPNTYFTNIKNQKNDQNQKSEKVNIDQLGFQELETNKETGLNPKYTFNNFIIGSFNELAHAAAMSIIKNPGKSYNPLFIYGPSGVGKTHLLQAIGNELLQQKDRKIKILYIPSEKFTNELINALKNHEIDNFKEKYKQINLLIVDDIQFLSGKEKTQEEFFYIFKDLYEENKQIILSSDRPPKSIATLEDRLRSRFEGGMIADINFPDYETRVAILKTKAGQQNIAIPDDILHYIANQNQKSIRELEGALNSITAGIRLNPSFLTLKNITKTLSNTISLPRKIINHKHVIQTVANFYNLTEKDLLNKKRTQEIVKSRQVAMFILRQELKNSFPFIGQKMGGKDHTTVMHACSKIERELEKDPLLNEEINLIKQQIYS